MQYTDKNRIMIATVTVLVLIYVFVSTVYTRTVYVGVCLFFVTRSLLKIMLSACDSPLPSDDHGGTARCQRTQVHDERKGSTQTPSPQGGTARLCALDELTRLTEAFVSTIERELTRGPSLRGASTIDDVGSESVAEPAPAKRTLQCRYTYMCMYS